MRPLILIFILLVTGCCAFPPRYDVEDLPKPAVFIEVVKVTNGPESKDDNRLWHVRLRFYETTKYNCLIQIIDLGWGRKLVEAFKMPGGRMELCRRDHHSSSSYGSRTMFVYPGTVVGADWRDNFAQLKRSEAGDVTNIGKNFNKKYQAEYETTGYVLEGDRSLGFTWSIDARADGVDVDTPPENTLDPR